MKKLARWLHCATFIVLFFSLTGTALAGSTVINVQTEGSGDIVDEVNGTTNLNGGTVWNGSDWVVNNTWAHKFFVDTRTGERLKSYPPERTRNYAGTNSVNDTYGNYTITASLYSYDKPAADGSGRYRTTGTRYTIADGATGLQTILLSRGLGLGTGASTFDIYFEMRNAASDYVTTALLGDPIWYQYSGRAADAVTRNSADLLRRGSLPGARTKQGTYAGHYFFDIGGGADLGPAGVGLSYEIFTSDRNPAEALTRNVGSTFATGFNLKYMDGNGDLNLLSFLPGLAQEELTPDTTLYFPHVDTNLPWQTEIAVINTGNQTITGALKAYSNTGQLVDTKPVALAAHGRRQIVVAAEFTNPASIGYIVFETDSAAAQGYTKFYQAGKYRAAIPAVKEVNTSNIYVSHIDSSAQWWTGISLVNTTAAPKELTVTFNNGQSRQITLAANQHRAFTIGELFNNQPQPSIKSAVIANAAGVIGLELFGTNDGKQLEGIPVTDRTASALYYPHVESNGWWTGIVAYNPSSSGCTITITPYSAQGGQLSPLTRDLAGKETYVGVVSQLGLPAQTAWFTIDSTSPIAGFELFGTADGNQLAAYAGVDGTGAKTGVFAKIEKAGWTGIAFVNREADAASVTLTAYNDNGSAVATQALPVGGHAKVVNLVEDIFPQGINGATYIAYSSDKNVVGFQLNGTSDNMLDGLAALAGAN